MLIDSHCHLDFFDNYKSIIANAQASGAHKFIVPSVNLESLKKILVIANEFENVFVAAGIHPSETEKRSNFDRELEEIEKILSGGDSIAPLQNDKIVAIGECGLDLPKEEDQKLIELQRKLFDRHLEWTEKYNLPIIIHNRRAGEEILEEVIEHKLRGVFHCFTGGKKLAEKISKQSDFYFGIGGLVTYDLGLAEVVKQIPIERIILETDSPYLMPKPIRDEKKWPNEPANIKFVAEKLAEIKEVSVDEIEKVTSRNCEELFGI
jgi:TatD DNase family protein